LAAKKQRRTLSSFIEFAIEEALEKVYITDTQANTKSISEAASQLWDVFQPDRFVKLALRYPDLLNHHEQVVWKLIQECGLVWRGKYSPPDDEWSWRVAEESMIWDRLRDHWETFNRVASGELDKSELPSWQRHRQKRSSPPDEPIPF